MSEQSSSSKLCRICCIRKVNSKTLCRRCAARLKCVDTSALSPLSRVASLRKLKDGDVLLAQMLPEYIRDRSQSWEASGGGFLPMLIYIDLSPPLLKDSVAAIVLAHFGSHHREPQLLRESFTLYGRALNTLAQTIRTNSNATSPMATLISMLLISAYSDEYPIETIGKWTTAFIHRTAVQHFIKSSGPRAFDLTSPFEISTLVSAWIVAFFYNMSSRKALVLGMSQWEAFHMPQILAGSPVQTWFPTVMPIPGLIEEIETILLERSDRLACPKLTDLASELDIYRQQTHQWAADRIDERKSVSMSDHDQLDMIIEEHCFMADHVTFNEQFCFDDFTSATFDISSWYASLQADITILRIFRSKQMKRNSAIRDRLSIKISRDIQKDAFEAAANLCKSTYYLSRVEAPGIVTLLSNCMDLARFYFRNVKAVKEYGWCEACMIATQVRLSRLEGRQERPLGIILDTTGSSTEAKAQYVPQPGMIVPTSPLPPNLPR